LELPEHGDGNGEDQRVGHDVEDGADVEVLRLEGAGSRGEGADLPVVGCAGTRVSDCLDGKGSVFGRLTGSIQM
jgi:hypothetical protein